MLHKLNDEGFYINYYHVVDSYSVNCRGMLLVNNTDTRNDAVHYTVNEPLRFTKSVLCSM